ncbi:MAG: hypothetical protein V4504_00365 [Patescibacteria group bacterium]
MDFIFEHIGFIAGALSFFAYLVYIFSILKKETRPSRSTWWILTFVGTIIIWSSYILGARENLWIQGSYVLGPLIIAILSLKYGEGSGFSKLDKICFAGALVSCLGWIIFNSPLIAFLGSIIVDFIGLLPTIKKSFYKPEEEDPNAWLIETTASILSMLAVTVWFTLDQKDWIYALYLFLVNFSITFLLWRKRIFNQST